MSAWLLRQFMRNRGGDPRAREFCGAFAGGVGIGCNVLLFIFKLIAGLLSGSIAIVADAVNNLSDAASSIVTLLGFRMARKPADREHPFGHARMEYMSGLFVAVAMILVGAELLRGSVEKIRFPQPVALSWLTFLILGVSIAVKSWMRSFYRHVGNSIHSAALKVSADDSRNDVITTAVVLLGAGIQYFWHLRIDGWLGAAVALFIIVSGVLAIRDTASPLIGEAPPQELVNELYSELLSYEGVRGVHDLMVHNYGVARLFATVHVEMDARTDPMKSHGIIDNMEREIEQKLGVRLSVHYDPIAPDDAETARLRELVGGIVAGIDPALTIHDLRVAPTHDHTNIIFDVAAPPEFGMSNAELRGRITAEMSAAEDHCYAVIEIDRNYALPDGKS